MMNKLIEVRGPPILSTFSQVGREHVNVPRQGFEMHAFLKVKNMSILCLNSSLKIFYL